MIRRALLCSRPAFRRLCSTATEGPAAKEAKEAKEAKDSAAPPKETVEPTESAEAKELADLRVKYLRSLAETENVRRRGVQHVSDAKVFAIQSFSKDLLEVADVSSPF